MPRQAQTSKKALKAKWLTVLIANVRRRRRALGLKPWQVSLRAGMKTPYVADLESRRARNPELETLAGLAHALQATPGQLLSRQPQWTVVPPASTARQVMKGRWLKVLIANVSRRRIQLDLTPAELSLQAGMKAPYVGDLEGGRTDNPALDTLCGLAHALQTTPAMLLTPPEIHPTTDSAGMATAAASTTARAGRKSAARQTSSNTQPRREAIWVRTPRACWVHRARPHSRVVIRPMSLPPPQIPPARPRSVLFPTPRGSARALGVTATSGPPGRLR